MRDSCDICFFLVEGRTTLASWFAGGTDPEVEGSYSIHEEEDVFSFISRAILCTKKIRFLQAKDEQSSYRAIGTVGLVAGMRKNWTRNIEADFNFPRQEVNRLHSFLMKRGIHWKVARRVAEEVGSVKELNSMYERSMPSCRPMLLAPIIMSKVSSLTETLPDQVDTEEVLGWSRAIHSAVSSELDYPDQVQPLIAEYKVFFEDHQEPQFVELIHRQVPAETAVDRILKETKLPSRISRRRVTIGGPSELLLKLGDSPGEDFKYVVKESNEGFIPMVSFQTRAGDYASGIVELAILEGREIVSAVLKAIQEASASHVSSAQRVASDIFSRLRFSDEQNEISRNVLVVKGLSAALGSAAKESSYRPEIRAIVDLLLAEIMMTHETVVLQAVKLSDVDMILRQFAKSCLSHQLLHQRA